MRLHAADRRQQATPLITKADGAKLGKTERGTVWLDPDLTVERPHARAAQRVLAAEVTALVHGSGGAPRGRGQLGIAASQALLGQGELRELDERTLDAAMAEAPTGQVLMADQPTIVDLLAGGWLVLRRGRRHAADVRVR